MHTCYEDILARIPTPPLWFDEHAVPRFDAFKPYMVADIYATEAVLYSIRCQNCGHIFHVASSWYRLGIGSNERLKDQLPYLSYGDPPNVGCCPSGPTMSSEPIRILEFWIRENHTWVRHPELEVELED